MGRMMLPLAVVLSLLFAAPAFARLAPPEQTGRPAAGGCDALDPSACMLPFPNDYFTVADPSTPTGRRVDFDTLGMPRNAAGKPIVPTDWNRADGFSPGSLIVTKVPGLDTPEAFAKTGSVPITDMARTYDPDAPVVLIDADTGHRALIWTELDMSVDQAHRTLLIRPGKNLAEGHRYIVALRHMRRADGSEIPPPPAFKALRDGSPTADPGRVAHYKSLFATLKQAGIARSDLYLAWDFTVASAQSLAGRMLHIRDDAFAQLGDTNLADRKVQGKAPTFTINSVSDQLCENGVPVDQIDQGLVTGDCPKTDNRIARDVKGTMVVPCYLDTPGCAPAHSEFVLGTDGLPVQIPGNVMKVDFECIVPHAALAAGPRSSRVSLYGHGLFGSYGEIHQGQLYDMASEHNITYCATNWEGMAETDIPNVATVLTDLSNFPTMADRVQQGMLNFLYLARLMIHPDGLSSDPAFQDGKGHTLLDTRRAYYDGNSQGGIIGGALAAVAPDYDDAVLGVPGMNYSTLLTRSSDFGTGQPPDPSDPTGTIEYAWPLYTSYPDLSQRQLIFSLMQMLWDRAEPDGYAEHMTTRPYPNTPPHQVMLHVALGDHQVANVTADVEARTIGAKLLRRPAEDPGRNADVTPHYGIPAFASLPARGSAIVIWDSGSPVAPTTNTAPTSGDDPHEHPRNTPAARAMKSAFLAPDSRVVDTCGGHACYAHGYSPAPAGTTPAGPG
jgi:hypothetical protein